MFHVLITEINTDAFAQFKFQRAKSPDIFKSKPLATQTKIRRSKSELDLRNAGTSTNNRAAAKRFQPTMENIPSKRLKMTAKPAAIRPQLNIKTLEKKKAILSTLKPTSTATSTSLKTNVTIVKKPLIKSSSAGSSIGSRIAAGTSSMANKSAITATSKNIAKPKIPPYDYKARFLDLKERFDTLKSKAEKQQEQISTLEEQNDGFGAREKELQDKIEKIEQELFDVTENKTQLESELETIRSSFENEIQTLKSANNNLTKKNNALSLDLSAKCDDLTTTKKNLSEITIAHEKQTVVLEDLQKMSGTLKHDFEITSNKLMLSQDQLYQINIERKVLHNMVLDLRGNIRVFARVRPPLLGLEGDRTVCGWSFNDESSLEIISNEIVQAGNRKQTKHDFAFDQVFDPNTTQDDIFETVSPLIQSALDGYNVCIFAYGIFSLLIIKNCIINNLSYRSDRLRQDFYNGWS